MEVKIILKQIKDLTDIDPKLIKRTPILPVLEHYYLGENFSDFEKQIIGKNKLEFKTSGALKSGIENIEKAIKDYFKSKENAKNFDHRLASLINGRFFKDIAETSWECLEFSFDGFDDEQREFLKEAFKNGDNISFCSYITFDNDDFKIFYNRKCLVDDAGELRLLTAKADRITLSTPKELKDCNVVSLKIIESLATTLYNFGLDVPFSYTYTNQAGEQIKKSSVNEILIHNADMAEAVEATITAEKKAQEVKEIAAAEIKAETMEKRASLPPESIKKELAKNETILKFDLEKADELYADFATKELEKTKQKLQKAQEQSKEAYASIKNQIAQGTTFADAFKYVKQQYSDYALDFALLKLTQDLAEIQIKENEINNLKLSINEKNAELEKKEEALGKAEENARAWQGNYNKKDAELAQAKNDFKQEKETLEKEAKKAINQLTNTLKAELDEAEKVIKEQNEVINHLENIRKNYHMALEAEKKLESKFNELLNGVAPLQNENNALRANITDANNEIAELENKLEEANNEIAELKKELEEAKNKIAEQINEYNEIVHKGNNFWHDARSYLVEAINRGYKASDSDKEFYEIDTNTQTQSNLFTNDDDGGSGSSRNRQR